ERALDVFVDLLPRLWKPAGAPFRPLAEEAAWWIEGVPERWEEGGRPFERELVDAALDALRELSVTQGEQVLLHQDFHALNVLAAEREPWLTVDPKPLAGGLPPSRRAVRSDPRPCAVRGGARRGAGGPEAASGARARRGDLDRVHRADRARDGRRGRSGARVCRRGREGLGGARQLRPVR